MAVTIPGQFGISRGVPGARYRHGMAERAVNILRGTAAGCWNVVCRCRVARSRRVLWSITFGDTGGMVLGSSLALCGVVLGSLWEIELRFCRQLSAGSVVR